MMALWTLWKSRLLSALIVIALVVGSYFYAYKQGADNEREKAIAAQAVANNIAQTKYNLVAQQYEELKSEREKKAETITRTVQKIVTRDVYRNICIDDIGLHLANEALAGRDTSKLDAEVQAITEP